MEQKKVLMLCDESDLDIINQSFNDHSRYSVTLETTEKILNYGVRAYLERTIELINQNQDMYQAVIGTHDSSAVFAAVICEYTGKIFAPVQAIINCQNKYISRIVQKKCIPEHTPNFCLALDYMLNPSQLSSPFFIKPVRSNISFGSHKISSPEELEFYIGSESKAIADYNTYFLESLSLCPQSNSRLNIETCNHFLCEDLVSGDQITVDGFVFRGDLQVFGATKAVFHHESNSFSHHVFPASLSPELEDIVYRKLSILLPELGIDNSFFNVEMRIDEHKKTFTIIEVNSRIAFQFSKTIQAVKGYDPLQLLCDVATGEEPDLNPESERLFPYCFNFELHTFSDKKIIKTPLQSGYEEIKLHYPEVFVRNLIEPGRNLSDYKHNPESFRYCTLDIPGRSKEEIMSKYEHITTMLNYEFKDI